jgi:hypothetical protein
VGRCGQPNGIKRIGCTRGPSWGCESGGRAGEDGHAEVDQSRPAVDRGPAEAVELVGGGAGADPESFDFAEPAVAASFAGAFAEVLDDLDEAAPSAGADLEDRAADAGVFVLAGSGVGPSTGARGNLA